MHREDDSVFLLYIEPKIEEKSETPTFDHLNKILMVAIQDSIQGAASYSNTDPNVQPTFSRGTQYRGVHECCDGAESANYDLYLPNGMITNTLALHYVTWFRKAIPATEMKKLEELERYYGKVNIQRPGKW